MISYRRYIVYNNETFHEGNYKEAVEIKKKKGYDIEIVSVKTLNDAIKYLEGLK